MLTAKRDVGPLEENVDLHHAFYGTTVSSLRNPPIMKSTFYKWRVFQDKKLKVYEYIYCVVSRPICNCQTL